MSNIREQLEHILLKLSFEVDHPHLEPSFELPMSLIDSIQKQSLEERVTLSPLLEKIFLRLGERIAQIEDQKSKNRTLYLEAEAQIKATKTSQMMEG